MPDLSIALFGPPQIKRGNEQISIQRRKDLALLIYLVVTLQPYRRDTLATLLWEDQSQAEARSNLRKSLSRLKSILGESVLLTSQDQVRINPNYSIDVDITQFNLRIQQVHQHGHSYQGAARALCRDCQKAWEEAARIYQADFLSGFSVSDSSVFEEWQFFQAESLRKSLAEVLEQLARLYANRQDYKTAIEYCRRWLALDRLNESAQRQLMTLYALSGQRAAAIRQFEECRRILKEELGAEPEEETVQLFQDLQKKRGHPQSGTTMIDAVPPTTAPRRLLNFPVHPAPFVGREKELGEIIHLLRESPYRLFSLLGPGGSGKTRLALQVGATLDREAGAPFRDEIWFVPLAPLTSPESILGGIAQSLGMPAHMSGSDARDVFFSEIRGREMLLILDNFEHLLNVDSTNLITEILSASPRTRILVTSRERLNLEGEFVFPVGGLEVPTEEALLAPREWTAVFRRFSALQLFEQCAVRVQPSFELTEENYRAIIDICQVVQGMPLAIELAAAWVEVYSPPEIRQEILRSLDFLQSNWRDLPDRQRSLRAVFDSSWTLLDKTTRPVIKALSVFRSSFTREAAQAVSGVSAKTLLDLNHKSWIQRLPNGRYQIHELLRQFAFEKLESEKATFALIMKQYGNYYAVYAARLWEDLKGANQQRALSRMEAEFDNMRVAWSWLVSANDIQTAVQNMLLILFHYAELRVKGDTLLPMLDMTLASLPPNLSGIRKQEIILRSAKGAFLQDGTALRATIPDMIFPTDTTSIRRAWTLAQKYDAFPELGFWGILLCYVYGRIIEYGEGVRQLEQVLPFFEETNQGWELAIGYFHLLQLLIPNEPSASRRRKQLTAYLSHARDLFASLGDTLSTGHILRLWGDLKIQQQDVAGAIRQWQLARHSFLNTGEWAAAGNMLWMISDACLQIGDFQKAFDGYREIADTFQQHGLRLVQISALSKESFEKARHGDLEEALQIRRTCLEMILETDVTYQYAWNYWEMGELQRLLGEPQAAREWYERAYQIFDREQDQVGRSYYFRGMGDIALGKKDYVSARDYFSTGVDLAKSANHTWMVCYCLSKLARAEMELQDVKSAKKNFRDAFQYGIKTLDKGILLVALAEYAVFCRKTGRDVRAVELCSLVSHHFASWHETKKQAERLLDSLKKSLPLEKFNQAKKDGRSLDIWETVTGLVDRKTRTALKLSKRSKSTELI